MPGVSFLLYAGTAVSQGKNEMPKLCVIPGDGIGQEVVPAAVTILQAAVPELELTPAEAGWDCFLKRGRSVPDATMAAIKACGAALFGAVSSPSRPVDGYRSAIITMRQALDLYANIRPVRSWPHVSPRAGVDLILVRENSEGLYGGREWGDEEKYVAERIVTRDASRRIAEKALAIAHGTHRKRISIIHKANILPLSDGLFRDTVRDVIGADFEVDELLVDLAALKMVSEPQGFDVLVTTNMFGDILSDAAAHWCGGLGMAPSLNWGDGIAVAEPVHGSAPDIAGKGIANPLATILSATLLVRHLWGNDMAAKRIETAVCNTLEQHQGRLAGTEKITESVLSNLTIQTM